MTGLRFFTVYGPWGRPDMALFLFTRNILAGKPIDVFNHGHHAARFHLYRRHRRRRGAHARQGRRRPNPQWNGAAPDPATSSAPYRLYNIGNNQPVELMHFIECIEKAVGRKAIKNLLPMQPGDVREDLCRRRSAGRRYRLPAEDADRGRRAALRGLVQGVLCHC